MKNCGSTLMPKSTQRPSDMRKLKRVQKKLYVSNLIIASGHNITKNSDMLFCF